MAAQIHRVTLPDAGQPWYTNNRPTGYTNVDPALKAKCDALNGACSSRFPNCVVPPKDNCNLNQQCSSTKQTVWGYCWSDAQGNGRRYKGLELSAISQSFCLGNVALLQSEPCTPVLKPACNEQQKCNKGREKWTELLTEGINPVSSMCGPAFQGMCKTGKPHADDPICKDFFGNNDLQYKSTSNDTCFFPSPVFLAAGWNSPKKINVTCARKRCESSSNCYGFSLKDDLSTVAYFGEDLVQPQYPNPANPHTCWAKPSPPDQSCTCLGGPLVKSHGCSKYPLHLPDRWVGPVCGTPTSQPTQTNQGSPTPPTTSTSPTASAPTASAINSAVSLTVPLASLLLCVAPFLQCL
mmetsp:Transcript_10406/g.19712  ORF Transcript_10406/g.19712 Transcript_10406/m.19712 type:complete len:352 (-) Transcript_10406:185-1240(-)